MTATFPAGVKAFSRQVDGVSTIDAADVNESYDEIEALEAYLLDPTRYGAFLRLDAANDPVTGALDIAVDADHALRVLTGSAPFGETVILDDFNRGNGALGDNWISADCAIENQRLAPGIDGEGNLMGDATWATPPAGPDQEVHLEIYADDWFLEPRFLDYHAEVLIFLRYNSGAFTNYALQIFLTIPTMGGPWTASVRFFRNGVALTSQVTVPYQSGDGFGFSVIGSVLTSFHKPVGGSWSALYTTVDTALTDIGQLHVNINGSNGDGTPGYARWTIDNFGGGISGLVSGGGDTIFDVNTLTRQTSIHQLVTTIPPGGAPLLVGSDTLNPNLNADLLDGQHAAAFMPTLAGTTTGDFIRYNAGTGAWEMAHEPISLAGLVLTPALASLVEAEGAVYYDSVQKAVLVCTDI
jgi:hypothetical protein